ncbi:MAG: hypothetical protein JWN93_1196 [Hyphomicrobiales bacterium]|nr:hypothetical protein [Hyphomicrobiales bacterium]
MPPCGGLFPFAGDKLMRQILAAAVALGALSAAWPADAQSPGTPAPVQAPAPSPSKPPASAAVKDANPPALDNVRIRGQVETVEANSVAVLLSQGISLKIDLQDTTPIFAVTRAELKDLSAGADVRVRTRSAPQGGLVAADVLVLSGALPIASSEALAELTMQGAYKAQDETNGEKVLVLTEKGGDRRVAVAQETTYWRLRPAALNEIKPGMALSVLIVKEADGKAQTMRAVFGSPATGTLLPL